MWSAATAETGKDSRILRMGYRGLASLCNLNPKSVKANLKSLEHKLAIQTIGEFNSLESTGRTYRVFSYNQILANRKAAGMLWVRKIKGVEFITGPLIENTPGIGNPPGVVSILTPSSSKVWPESTPDSGEISNTAPVAETTPLLNSSLTTLNHPSTSSASPQIVRALRQHTPRIDDDAVRRLTNACRRRAPDATDEEIVHFIHLKASSPGIKAPIGFLIAAVPKCFEGESLRQFREAERQSKDAEERARLIAESEIRAFRTEQECVLQDPDASEEEKAFAKRMLDLGE